MEVPHAQNSPGDRTTPEELDEGYWSALLHQGEYAIRGNPHNGSSGWHGDRNDGFSGSVGHFATQQDWDNARRTFDRDEVLTLLVTGFNKGGLLVTWNSLRGFVPASQLNDFPVDVDENQRKSLLAQYINHNLKLRIIELDIEKNRLILSERAALVGSGQRSSVLHSLKPGETLQGLVTNLCDFGAFVDLGGVEGLIHISELSWGRVNHPRDVLQSGQQVKVHILSVDVSEERIALSVKRLQPDPWATVSNRYEIGETVEGVITNVVDFGAFACIEDGLEGLIHISELAEGQFLHPRNVVKEGDRVQARILNIDGPSRRLGLSLRLLNGDNTQQPQSQSIRNSNGHLGV